MATKKSEPTIHDKLSVKFSPDKVDWVIVNAFDFNGHNGYQIKAFAIPYIQKEVAEQLADKVFGAENWVNDFEILSSPGWIKLTIKYKNPETGGWVSKRGASSVNQNEKGNFAENLFESAITFAEKRAWSKVGIGRYLKLVGQIEVEVSQKWKPGWNKYSFRSKVDKDTYVNFYWQEPQLPAKALPEGYEYNESTQPRQDPDPPTQPSPEPATEKDWKVIMAYYNSLPPNEQSVWDSHLFTAKVNADGEITGQDPKNFSHDHAIKIITSLIKGYGELNKQGVPEDIADPAGTELEEEARKDERNRKGVSVEKVMDLFDGEIETEKK